MLQARVTTSLASRGDRRAGGLTVLLLHLARPGQRTPRQASPLLSGSLSDRRLFQLLLLLQKRLLPIFELLLSGSLPELRVFQLLRLAGDVAPLLDEPNALGLHARPLRRDCIPSGAPVLLLRAVCGAKALHCGAQAGLGTLQCVRARVRSCADSLQPGAHIQLRARQGLLDVRVVALAAASP